MAGALSFACHRETSSDTQDIGWQREIASVARRVLDEVFHQGLFRAGDDVR